MKINIFYDFQQKPGGGASQFLTALRRELKRQNCYTDVPSRADAIIYNSYHCLIDAVSLKMKHPDKLFLHRLGPFFHLHRAPAWRIIDRLILETANTASDAVIWQSKWALNQARRLNYRRRQSYTIIGNAPDSRHFNQSRLPTPRPGQKIKLVACSWSANPNKGFAIYRYLDDHLDFNKYAMSFIGRSPVRFRRIKQLGVLPTAAVAAALKRHHIFVSGARKDAHANTIVEALACGLPVVAPSSGANEEIVKKGGELFSSPAAALAKINLVAARYRRYQEGISVPGISHIARQYLQAAADAAGSKAPASRARLVLLHTKLTLASLILNLLSKPGLNVPPGFRRCHLHET